MGSESRALGPGIVAGHHRALVRHMTKLNAVSYRQVRIKGGFWHERVRVNRQITLPIEYAQCKSTGRIDAFRLDWRPGDPDPPHVFWDSDVAKWVEAASYSIATCPDTRLEKRLESVVGLIAGAQQEDGYLNTHFTAVAPAKRWSNLRDQHELYCAGHLIEAAVAHHEATGKRILLEAMCRYADYIDTVFGRARGKKRGYPGHEEIELALVKLYRATGNSRYLRLAKFFLDERGQRPHYFDKEARERGEVRNAHPQRGYDHWQAHLPVRRQQTAEGHAVRACYLYAGMADVAAETQDRELLAACRAIWKNIVTKRMYVHGGVGSTRLGERFTLDYDLPNEDAYAETCAAIALVFFAHRMLQIQPDRQYADVMERCLYNCVISGVSLDGARFFYDNYLASFPGRHRFAQQKPPIRQEWFGCACCPPNIARLLASLGQYIYSVTSRTAYVHLFVSGEAEVDVADTRVRLVQTTEYPWDGSVRIDVHPEREAEFTIAVRVPGWCRSAGVTVNGRPQEVAGKLRLGYLKLRRKWRDGDRIVLALPMPVERVEAHPSVREDCGRIALQRGPIVYCLEEKDNGRDLNDIVLEREGELRVRKGSAGLFEGIPVIHGKAFRRCSREWQQSLYRTDASSLRRCTVHAIPYFMWANRGEGEMLAWIRQA